MELLLELAALVGQFLLEILLQFLFLLISAHLSLIISPVESLSLIISPVESLSLIISPVESLSLIISPIESLSLIISPIERRLKVRH